MPMVLPATSATIPTERRSPLLALAILAAMVFFALLYKYTLRAWFMEDDFAWLALRLQVHSAADLLHALFAPMAQGTVRPLSERAFFMVFSSLFGLHALPSRILVYITELGDIALLGMIAFALTRSYWASFWAPVLWIANDVLAWPLTWTAAYNEILASFVFLVSFYALVRYIETGNWKFNALQWAAYLIGFGVLEINVMYPVIAMVYVVLFARKFLKQEAFLLLPAIAFTVVDRLVQAGGDRIYQLHLDASMFATLARYCDMALGPSTLGYYFPPYLPAVPWMTALLAGALLGFTGWRLAKRDPLPLFCVGWFFIAVAPFLPIRDHITNYYLTVPTLGLALLGAYAIVRGFRRPLVYRAFTVLLVAIYLGSSIPSLRRDTWQIWMHSVPVKRLVLGVEAAHEADPNKTIILEGVDRSLFMDGVYDHPFRLFGANEVYLAPDSASRIPPDPTVPNFSEYVMPEGELRNELARDQVAVYNVEEGQLREITSLFKSVFLGLETPRHIDMGHPSLDSLLDSSWYSSEGDYRWMPKEASVRLGVPPSGEGELRLEVFCVPVQIQAQPITTWVTVAGKPSPRTVIRDCSHPIQLKAPIQVEPGTKEVNVTVHVDHTIRVGADVRDLGLAVRTIEIVGPGGSADQQ